MKLEENTDERERERSSGGGVSGESKTGSLKFKKDDHNKKFLSLNPVRQYPVHREWLKSRVAVQPEAYVEFYNQFAHPLEQVENKESTAILPKCEPYAGNTLEEKCICADSRTASRNAICTLCKQEHSKKYKKRSAKYFYWWSRRFAELERQHLDAELKAKEKILCCGRAEKRKVVSRLHREYKTSLSLKRYGPNREGTKWSSASVQTEVIGSITLKLVSTLATNDVTPTWATQHLTKLKHQAIRQRKYEAKVTEILENDLMQQEEIEQRLVYISRRRTEEYLDFRIYMNYQALFGELPDWAVDKYFYDDEGILGRLPGRRYYRIVLRAVKHIYAWWNTWWPIRKKKIIRSARCLQRIYRGHLSRIKAEERKQQLGYVEKCVRRIKYRSMYLAWSSWMQYTRRNIQIKQMIYNALRSIKHKTFEIWKEDFREKKHKREAKLRIAMARLRFRTELNIMTNWSNYAKKCTKIKLLCIKRLIGTKSTVFDSWCAYTTESIYIRTYLSRSITLEWYSSVAKLVVKNKIEYNASVIIQSFVLLSAYKNHKLKKKRLKHQLIQWQKEYKKIKKRFKKLKKRHKEMMERDEEERQLKEDKFVRPKSCEVEQAISAQCRKKYSKYMMFSRRERSSDPLFLQLYLQKCCSLLKQYNSGDYAFSSIQPIKQFKRRAKARKNATDWLVRKIKAFSKLGYTIEAQRKWNPCFSSCVLPSIQTYNLGWDYINASLAPYSNRFTLEALFDLEASSTTKKNIKSNLLEKDFIQLHIGLCSEQGFMYLLRLKNNLSTEIDQLIQMWNYIYEAKDCSSSFDLAKIVAEVADKSFWWSSKIKTILQRLVKSQQQSEIVKSSGSSQKTLENEFETYKWVIYIGLVETEYSLVKAMYEKLDEPNRRRIFEAQTRNDAACLGIKVIAARVLQKYARRFMAGKELNRLRMIRDMGVEDIISKHYRDEYNRKIIQRFSPIAYADIVRKAIIEYEITKEKERILALERKKYRCANKIQRVWRKYARNQAVLRRLARKKTLFYDHKMFSWRTTVFKDPNSKTDMPLINVKRLAKRKRVQYNSSMLK